MGKIELNVKMGEDYSLQLSADNMNKLVEKIIEWQHWDAAPQEYFERKGRLKKEKNSGWYYIPES